jgi:hypothetical protein
LSELVEHWQYFVDREGADYSLEVTEEMAVMKVRQCPAVAHLHKLGLTPSNFFCDQTVLLNEAWCEGTPFEAVTELTGDGSCVQRIGRSSKMRECESSKVGLPDKPVQEVGHYVAD